MTADAEPTAPQPDAELPGAIQRSPDRRRIRERRAKLTGWRRRVYDYLVVPAEVPTEFNEPLEDLVAKLATDDAMTAASTLDEAQAIHQETSDRIESAERRATTLQGTVAVAASLTIAAAGFLLDRTKVANQDWRIVLLILLAGFLVCLIGCAWRALAVTGRMFEFEQPGPERIFRRAQMAAPQAETLRAAELLRAAGVASEVGAVKVGLLRSAAWWLRAALGVLAVLVVVLGANVVAGGDATSSATPLGQPSFRPRRLPPMHERWGREWPCELSTLVCR